MLLMLNNCLRFLALPLFVACFLAILHITDPNRSVGFTQKLGAALAMYGLGSIIPYFLSDEILHRKFGEVSDSEHGYTVTFRTKQAKETFDFIKNFLWNVFIVGLFFGTLNNIIPVRLSTPQPFWATWFWTTGVGFCILTGVLFVILNTRPDLSPGPPISTREARNGGSQNESAGLNPKPATFGVENGEQDKEQKEVEQRRADN
jgi:hypothetical protein